MHVCFIQGNKKARVSRTTDRLLAYSGPPSLQAVKASHFPSVQSSRPHRDDVNESEGEHAPQKVCKFEVASHALQLSTVPEELPCRYLLPDSFCPDRTLGTHIALIDVV